MTIQDQDLARLQALFWDGQRAKQPPMRDLKLANDVATFWGWLRLAP